MLLSIIFFLTSITKSHSHVDEPSTGLHLFNSKLTKPRHANHHRQIKPFSQPTLQRYKVITDTLMSDGVFEERKHRNSKKNKSTPHFLQVPENLLVSDPSKGSREHPSNCSNCGKLPPEDPADFRPREEHDPSSGIIQNSEILLQLDPLSNVPSEPTVTLCPQKDKSFSGPDQANGSNCSSSLEHAPTLERATVVKAVVLSVLSGLGVAGNAATLVSIWRRRANSTLYLLLVQLAVADILVSVFCLMADAAWTATVQWRAGDAACKALKFMQMFSLYLSTYVLVLIGFDRLCAVRFPMARVRAKYYVRNAVVFVWLFSAALSSPQAVIFRVLRGPFVEEFHQCVTFGFYTAPWQEQLYTSLSLLMMFLLPLVILIVTYITTFATIANQENMFSERTTKTAMSDARHRILHKAKMKSLLITVVIVLAFVVCWTPYYATMVVFIFLEPDEALSDGLQTFVFFFGSSTAVINPLIYGAFHLRRKGGGKRKAAGPKSTTLVNNSSSSRVEISLTTFQKGTL